MSISAFPTIGTTAVPKSVKPDSQIETFQPPERPAKAVINPLEADPTKQPDPKAAAEYYAYVSNEKARRRREKANK